MARHGLVFDALVLLRQLPGLLRFARRHPQLRSSSTTRPSLIARGEIEPWRADMAQLAALPQVHCKLSGLLTERASPRCGRAAAPKALWQLFGPQRLVWGSDWPVLRLAGDYAGWWRLAHDLLTSLDPAPTALSRRRLWRQCRQLYRLTL